MELKMENLSKKYGDVYALAHVSMTLTNGIYGLLGPNGAGKSTLMNILVGNLEPSEGEIFCNGKPIRELGNAYRACLGFVPQQQKLYPWFSGREFLGYMAVLKNVPVVERKERVEWAAGQVNLLPELGKYLRNYSGGMKQRILLAAALLNNPDILVMDEPTAGLDPGERIRIRNMISEIAEKKIVLIATHVVSDIEMISREVILLNRGKLVRKAAIAELTREIARYVFEVECDIESIPELEKQYLLSGMNSDGQKARVHLIVGQSMGEESASKSKQQVPISKTNTNDRQTCMDSILEKMSEQADLRPAIPTLEDVYLYHFRGCSS